MCFVYRYLFSIGATYFIKFDGNFNLKIMIELPIKICILVLNVFSYINKNILTTKTAKHGYDSIVKAVRTRKRRKRFS